MANKLLKVFILLTTGLLTLFFVALIILYTVGSVFIYNEEKEDAKKYLDWMYVKAVVSDVDVESDIKTYKVNGRRRHRYVEKVTYDYYYFVDGVKVDGYVKCGHEHNVGDEILVKVNPTDCRDNKHDFMLPDDYNYFSYFMQNVLPVVCIFLNGVVFAVVMFMRALHTKT